MQFSKEKQTFKIGRISYSLPNRLLDHDKKEYCLSFYYIHWRKMWVAGYRSIDNNSMFNTSEPTFNKALKALNAKIKDHELNNQG